MTISRILTTAVAASIGLSVAVSPSDAKEDPKVILVESQLEIRALQTRAFDTGDENRTLRAILSTLLDLGFLIDDADEALGTISAVRRYGYRWILLTVTVRKRRTTQVLVRINATYEGPVRDPVIYRNFFTSLAKSMSLTANPIK